MTDIPSPIQVLTEQAVEVLRPMVELLREQGWPCDLQAAYNEDEGVVSVAAIVSFRLPVPIQKKDKDDKPNGED